MLNGNSKSMGKTFPDLRNGVGARIVNAKTQVPYRPRQRNRPTFYLDHSTICDAFKAEHGGLSRDDAKIYRPLYRWIERVAVEANLCFSFAHLRDLSRWRDIAMADGMCAWLDSLPTTWLRDDLDRQAEEELRRALGAMDRDPEYPFVPSLLRIFVGIDPKMAGQILFSHRPLHFVLTEARKLDPNREDPGMRELLEIARSDEQWVSEEGWSHTRKQSHLDHRAKEELRELACAAHERLCASDPSWAPAGSQADVAEALVHVVDREPAAMRGWRVAQRFTHAYKITGAARKPGSRNEASLLTSALYDHGHAATGGAYCDVFTCDKEVSRWLGELRVTFGLDRQLSAGELGPPGFVAELMATWPADS